MAKPIWKPKHPQQSAMWRFMEFVSQAQQCTLQNYQDLHQWSVQHPDLFWSRLCDFFKIQFDTPAKQVLNQYHNMMDARFFEGAKLNFAQHLLSRQDDHTALICLNENQERVNISYKQLYQLVAQCAAGLKKAGVGIDDRVAGMVPNSQYAVIAMLATTSLGAIWSSCSPDFGAQAASDRLGQVEPKVLFIVDGHQYHGKTFSAEDKIRDLQAAIPSIKQLVVLPNIHQDLDLKKVPKTISWQDFLQPATSCEFVSLDFNHPVYILFSSGTTGKPKCIVHGAGGTLLQHIKELGLHSDLQPEDILCFYTTCGWMMWNWSISALALGATLILYDGSPTFPQADSLIQLLAKEKVTIFGTSAKYLLAIEKEGVSPKSVCDINAIRLILSTGSPLLPKSYDFVYTHFKQDLQLSSISGGTDIVSCFALGNPLLPVYKGELQCLGLGMAVAVYDETGKPLVQHRGELVCTTPFPAMPVMFWNDKDNSKYQQAYFARFPGVWAHGDFAEETDHHGLIIYGRSDAVLNPGGVRIGTAEIYKLVEQVEEVVDSVVIGQNWDDDVRVVLFVQLRPGLELNEAIEEKIRHLLKVHASPRHVPAKILQVPDIPRTMSGKTVELAVRQVVHGEEVVNLQSLANPQALKYFKNRLELKE